MSVKGSQKVLIVERDLDNIWTNLPQLQRKPLLSYRGFDAQLLWFNSELDGSRYLLNVSVLNENKVDITQFSQIKKHYHGIKKHSNKTVDLLLLAEDRVPYYDNNFIFIGYDIGIIEEFNELVFFSVILNEIREYGNSYLNNFANKLNEYYLLPTRALSIECIKARTNAFKNNATVGIETAYPTEQMQIIALYCYL